MPPTLARLSCTRSAHLLKPFLTLQANLFNLFLLEVYDFNRGALHSNITGIRLVVKAWISHLYFNGAFLQRKCLLAFKSFSLFTAKLWYFADAGAL